MFIDEDGVQWRSEYEWAMRRPVTFPAWNDQPKSPFWIVSQINGAVSHPKQRAYLEDAVRFWADTFIPVQRNVVAFILDAETQVILGYDNSGINQRWYGSSQPFQHLAKHPNVDIVDHVMWELSARGELDDVPSSLFAR